VSDTPAPGVPYITNESAQKLIIQNLPAGGIRRLLMKAGVGVDNLPFEILGICMVVL
jgi:hypothetical protein